MDESSLVIKLWAAGTLVALLFVSLVVLLSAMLRKRAIAHQLERENWKLQIEKTAVSARLEERDLLVAEFSREIHDNIGQLATMVRMHLQVLEKQVTDAPQQKTIDGAMTFANALMDSIQHISYSMDGSYIHEEGLFNAIGWQVDQIRSSRAIDIRLESPGTDIPLTVQQALVVYRIAQEAISNVLHHAGASELVIRLHYTDNEFTMDIMDDGKGFDPAVTKSGKVGIRNMEHRAQILGGKLEVKSWLDSGTTVRLVVPLGNNTSEDILRTSVHHE